MTNDFISWRMATQVFVSSLKDRYGEAWMLREKLTRMAQNKRGIKIMADMQALDRIIEDLKQNIKELNHDIEQANAKHMERAQRRKEEAK